MKAWLAPAVLATVLVAPLRVYAADVQTCINASEKGQRARGAGKLREARDLFQVCANDACPAMVRRDCVQWQQEIATTLPTVVFGAKDKQGRDLIDVTVSMDGEVLLTKLDGKSVPVDPGAHTFKFEVQGSPPVTEKVLVKESEKSRIISASFGGDGAPGSATPPAPQAEPPREPGSGHTVLPWVLVGVGGATMLVGLYLIIRSPELPPNCDADTKQCKLTPGMSAAELAESQDLAGKHDRQPVLGAVITGAGGALVLGGLLWHFLEPTGPDTKSARVRVLPWTSPTLSGVALDARF